MLNVAVAKVGLQGAGVVALVGQGITASVLSMCGCALKTNLASLPARSTMRAKPAVLNGAPRSEVNTKGDFGMCQ